MALERAMRYSSHSMALVRLGREWFPRIERCLEAFETKTAIDTVERLARLLDRVVEWNEKLDLTAARDPDELVDLFVADAAKLAAAEPEPVAHWVDVGSGAGAPGLPLAVLLPAASFSLVEPKAKRVAFLRTALGALGLARVDVERMRSDALPSSGFDLAVSRATLEPQTWLEEGARLARRAVWVLTARSEPPAQVGWSVDLDCTYSWPLTGVQRRALRYSPNRVAT